MHDHVSILYFQNRTDSSVEAISIDKEGGIEVWPENFFDQTRKDLRKILNIGNDSLL